jgi:hypothetical protein
VRALVFGLAGAAVTLTVAARLVGPVTSWTVACVAWCGVGLATLCAGGFAMRGLARLVGPGAAELLAGQGRGLASETRSAAELARDAAYATSPELVAAHAVRVEASLAAVPPNVVLPWRALRSRALGGAAGTMVVCALVWALDPTTVAGAWALAHPGARHEDAVALAAIVERCDARLVFPAYLGRASQTVEGVVDLEAPLGTTVELSVRPRVSARSGTIDFGGHAIRLVRGRDGRLSGRFVVRASGPLGLRLRTSDGEVRDARSRTVRALRDEAPRVSLSEPAEDRVVESNAEIPIVWAAKDDGAIREVELVLIDAEGREIRRRLGTYVGEARKPGVAGTASVRVEALGARPGDRIVMHVEARDCDDVSGPNEGRSAERTLTIAGDATRREASYAALRAALDAILGVLAEALEQPFSQDFATAQARFDALSEVGDQAGRVIDAAASAMLEDPVAERDDALTVRAIASDVRNLATDHWELFHDARNSSAARRSEVESGIVALLERDTLVLEDMLARSRLDDAVALAQELNRQRQRMASLLAALRRQPDEATRRALLAEIARAEAQMRELAARLAQMEAEVPGEFANAEAMQIPETETALASLREAVERNDLDAAMRHLAALENELSEMRGAIEGGTSDFENARSSGDAQALAAAIDGVRQTLAQQRQVASETASVRSRAASRAAAALASVPRETTRERLTEAQRLRAQLGALDRDALDEESRADLDAAREALHDLEEALRAGQLANANELAERADSSMLRLDSAVRLEAQMRGARDRAAAARARLMSEAQRQTYGLRQRIDDLVPSLREHIDDVDRAQMESHSASQTQLGLDTDALAERFSEGPNGAPLSAEAADALRSASSAMRQASDALDDASPQRASEEQDRAIAILEEMLKKAEEQRSQRARGGRGRGRGQRGGMPTGENGGADRGGGFDSEGDPSQDVVRIPDGSDFVGPAERRRRVLDAMRDDAPGGFEEAVRRYYEAILR